MCDIKVIRLKDNTFYEARNVKMCRTSYGNVVTFTNSINDNLTMVNASLVRKIHAKPQRRWVMGKNNNSEIASMAIKLEKQLL